MSVKISIKIGYTVVTPGLLRGILRFFCQFLEKIRLKISIKKIFFIKHLHRSLFFIKIPSKISIKIP